MSYWLHTKSIPKTEDKIASDADVVIIGGGFTGISCAYWLKKLGSNKKVVLLEQREGLSEGATGRNGGHLWPGTESLSDEINLFGEAEAKKIWNFTVYNFDLVKELVEANKIDCEFRPNGSAHLAVCRKTDNNNDENNCDCYESKLIRETYEIWKSKGLAGDMELWDKKTCKEKMKCDLFCAGLHTNKAAQLWPAKLVWGVANLCKQMGVTIYTNTEVASTEFSQDQKVHIIKTNKGIIKAKQVVFATNAYTGKLLPQYASVIKPVRGQVICSSPVPKVFPYGHLANDGYEYWTQQPNGRILLGGMRWKSKTEELNTYDDVSINDDVSKGLHDFLKKLTENVTKDVKVDFEWTGIMGFSADRKPLVGPIPNLPNAFVAAGFTGHGMPLIFGSGQAIASMVENNGICKIEKFPAALLPERFNKREKKDVKINAKL